MGIEHEMGLEPSLRNMVATNQYRLVTGGGCHIRLQRKYITLPDQGVIWLDHTNGDPQIVADSPRLSLMPTQRADLPLSDLDKTRLWTAINKYAEAWSAHSASMRMAAFDVLERELQRVLSAKKEA